MECPGIATLFFTATGPGSGEVSLSGIMLLDSNFQEVSLDTVNAAAVAAAVPEPPSWVLMLIGAGFLTGLQRVRATRNKASTEPPL